MRGLWLDGVPKPDRLCDHESWGFPCAMSQCIYMFLHQGSSPASHTRAADTQSEHAGLFPGMWFHCTKFLRGDELTLAYAVILSSAVVSQVSLP